VQRSPFISKLKRESQMVYAVASAEVTPRLDSEAECVYCDGAIAWDEVFGWLHTSGWYACRWPLSDIPREVMAGPRQVQR
jgi:hypothetical protein